MKNLYFSFQESRWFSFTIGILSIVLGFILLLAPQLEMEKIALYMGIIILIYGVVRLITGFVAKTDQKQKIINIIIGALAVILAIVDFANLSLVGKYLPAPAGFFMAICGIVNLVRSLGLLKNKVNNWWIGAVISVIVLILGIVIVTNPGFAGSSFGVLLGITALINGVSNLASFAGYQNGSRQ